MEIYINIEDENLNYKAVAFCKSFESAEEEFGKMKRNYERRVQMELDRSDVMAYSLKEEQF